MSDPMVYTKLLRKNRIKRCPDCDVDVISRRAGEYECSRCHKVFYDDFGRVRNYLEENPQASIQDIMIDTKVSRRTIQDYLDYCHLEYRSGARGHATCERCGAPIRCGKICPSCATLMSEGEFDPQTVGDYTAGYLAKKETKTRMIRGGVAAYDEGERGRIRYLDD